MGAERIALIRIKFVRCPFPSTTASLDSMAPVMGSADEATSFPSLGGAGDSAAAGTTTTAAAEEWEYVEPPHLALAEDENDVFPPSLHEGLHHHLNPLPHVGLDLSASATENEEKKEEEEEEERRLIRWPFSGSARRCVGSGLEMMWWRIPAAWRGEGGGWSFAAVAGLIGCLIYLRRRQRRERELFLLLNKEKDQRIRQLLNQIAEMNASRGVPVLVRRRL